MIFSVKRSWTRVKRKAYIYLRCGAKTATFLFWATLYMVVMKMTVFKSNVDTPVRDWSITPDNYTKWQLQGPVSIADDELESNNNDVWWESQNETIIELAKRKQTVQDVCNKRGYSSLPINYKEFFIDHGHGFVWCNIFKAASSFWLYNLNILGGYDENFLARSKKDPLNLARNKFPRPGADELEAALEKPGVVSLLIVREPFVRLLSAYRDKLENLRPFYRNLAKSMVSKHREKKKSKKKRSRVPTFYEFVKYLISENINSSGYRYNEHWAPYYRFCSPCSVNYSVIAKVETLTRDSMYVIQQLGLPKAWYNRVQARQARQRNVMNKSRDGKNTTSLLRKYFSQLDKNMLNALLKIYGTDFEMFGYDAKIYERYVKQ